MTRTMCPTRPVGPPQSLYFGCPEVDAAYQHLAAKGFNADPPKVTWCGMKQLYLKDPDGFGICFQWSADSWMERA